MKNFFKNIALVVAVLAFTSVSAAKKFEVSVNQTKSLVNISLESVSVGERLAIKSYEGISIFRKTFRKTSNFQKTFSLKEVNNGVYFVEIENNNQIQITPVLKNDLGVTLINQAAKFIFKPQFLLDGDLFKVSLMNPNEGLVQIKILSEVGDTIVTEDLVDQLVVKRIYDTEELPRGVYTVLVTKGGKTFTNSINVN